MPLLPHDVEGVFSGCMLTHGPRGEENCLTVVYTAVSFCNHHLFVLNPLTDDVIPQVSHLPIHFTKPYHWGSEKLALAVSTDGGKSWCRDESSVILQGPPEELKGELISWRDPFIATWPEMDEHLGFEKGAYLYGLISGGIKEKTPTAFLYRIEPTDLMKWTFVSMVADVGLNYSIHPKSGDMGQNWEVCNFFCLDQEQFLIMNVEGVGKTGKGRHAMWSNVDLKGDSLIPRLSGLIDHGCLYAVTTFHHAPSQRRLLWGWITEDDLAESRYEQQGWSGCMSLPREMQLLTYQDVDKSVLSDKSIAAAFKIIEETDKNTLQLQTLGWRPAVETRALREGAIYYSKSDPDTGALPVQSSSLELELEINIQKSANASTEIGLLVCHNSTLTRYTKIVYRNETIYIFRSNSTKDIDVTTTTISAPLKLLPFANGTLETLKMHLFIDNSVLELFVNDRITLTTRIYCDDVDAKLVSFYNADPKHASFKKVEAWSGLQSAMMDAFEDDDAAKL